MSRREDFLLHEFQHQQIDKDDLDCQNYRQTNIEFGMLGLMAKEVHTGDGTDAAANDRNANQRFLRNAPEISLGFVLVYQHKKESYGID